MLEPRLREAQARQRLNRQAATKANLIQGASKRQTKQEPSRYLNGQGCQGEPSNRATGFPHPDGISGGDMPEGHTG